MTRSSRNRRNTSARRIAVCLPRQTVIREVYKYGAFHEESARRFAVVSVNPQLTGDVNWPYCAELLNKMTLEVV